MQYASFVMYYVIPESLNNWLVVATFQIYQQNYINHGNHLHFSVDVISMDFLVRFWKY